MLQSWKFLAVENLRNIQFFIQNRKIHKQAQDVEEICTELFEEFDVWVTVKSQTLFLKIQSLNLLQQGPDLKAKTFGDW